MNRTTFLIDGFNLYHSVRQASKDLKGASTKWLDIRALCSSYLYLIGGGTSLEKIYYFTALAYHMDKDRPGTTKRHKTFIRCLKSTGVIVEESRFKRRFVNYRDGKINLSLIRHEEKETDVAIAVKLIEIFHLNECDTAILMTGDTDLAPAIKTAQRLFPSKAIWVLFPYRRSNQELRKLVGSKAVTIKQRIYSAHQFADPFVLPDGTKINKPGEW